MNQNFLTMQAVLEGHTLGRGPAVGRGGKSMAAGAKPVPFPKGIGLKTIKPGELLSVRVPVVRIVAGKIEGYQRSFQPAKARAIARWMKENKDEYLETLPVVEISINGNGQAYFTDGQHRAAGAIIAGFPLRAVITKRTQDQQRRLFALQGKASRPSRNLMIFDSDGPFEEYIQDAITSDDHPWSNLITSAQTGGSKTRMSATAAYTMLRIFVSGKNAPAGKDVGKVSDDSGFDKEAADLLAVLMSSFGTRQSNPLAYSALGLRAISLAARAVFRSRESDLDDLNRWIRTMPSFQFGNYSYIKSSTELADQMIRFWNRRLPDARKASRIE